MLTRNVQFVLSVLREPEEHMEFSDLDCTACMYDGKSVICVPRFVRAINTRTNLVGPDLIRNKYEQVRISKYVYPAIFFPLSLLLLRFKSERGFAARLFELCKHHPRCDVEVDSNIQKDLAALIETHSLKPWTDSANGSIPDHISFEESQGVMSSAVRFVTGSIEQLLREPISDWDGIRWKWQDILQRTGSFFLPRCYTCNVKFFPEEASDALCDECKSREARKWEQWDNVSLKGRTALITGARVKIGFQCALRLLRSGCRVIAVTRYPNDAFQRYSREPDFDKWKKLLHVYGLDLCHLPSVGVFIAHVSKWYPKLDILINNAAQTIRKSREFYAPMIELEKAGQYSRYIKHTGTDPLPIAYPVNLDENEITEIHNTKHALAFSEDTKMRSNELFPLGMTDTSDKQLNLKTENSWEATIEQVSVMEALEVQTINATVPFMMISQLTPALKAAAKEHKSAFVVNVTSAEGDFNMNWKNDSHPHTNMAKASLNMMTKSISVTFAFDSIFANAVDTGTLLAPPSSTKPPLSDLNGASRVLDPIFVGILNYPGPYGQLFRNFRSVPWV